MPVPAEEDAASEVSECERRERGGRRRRSWVPLFLPTPSFMASADEEKGGRPAFLGTFLCYFLGA